ncbi:hypothetical protein HK405_005893 [Cladochytrium tenue]|nr:hypothetical protein HK405_005893 [Cladochytrium tenue]
MDEHDGASGSPKPPAAPPRVAVPPPPMQHRQHSIGGHLIVTTVSASATAGAGGGAASAPGSPILGASAAIVPSPVSERPGDLEAYGDSDLASVDMGRSPSRNRSFAKPRAPSVSSRLSRRSARRDSIGAGGDDTDSILGDDSSEYHAPITGGHRGSSVKSVGRAGSLLSGLSLGEAGRSKSLTGRQASTIGSVAAAGTTASATSVAYEEMDAEQLQRRVRKLERRLFAAYQEKMDLEGTVEALKRRVAESSLDADYRRRLEDTQSMTLQETREVLAAVERQASKLQKDGVDLERRLTKADAEVDTAKEMVRTVERREAALSGQIVHLRSEKMAIEEALAHAMSELEVERRTRQALELSEGALSSRVQRLEERLRQVEAQGASGPGGIERLSSTASSTTSSSSSSTAAAAGGESAAEELARQQLQAQIEDLATTNAALVEELQALGAGPSAAAGALGGRSGSGRGPGSGGLRGTGRLHVPPRISSAVKLLDHLPPGGALDEEIWKGMVAEKKVSEIERITYENDMLKLENASLRSKLGMQ